MSNYRSPSPDRIASAVIEANAPCALEQQALRCQWCSVPLATGVTVCPTCGSSGVPDPRITVASLTDLETSQPDPIGNADAANGIAGADAELAEWRFNETAAGEETEEPRQTLDVEAVERHRTQSMIFIGGSVLVCAVLGWLIGPSLLVGPFERLTGTTVDAPSDLRTMGAVVGLIAGMFIGATGGWVIWADS